MQWVILGTGSDDGLVWSNALGWDEIAYDVFSDEEKAKYQLPINGVWFNNDDMENALKVKELLCLRHCFEDFSLLDMLEIYKKIDKDMLKRFNNIKRVYEDADCELEDYLFELAQKLKLVVVL